MRHFDTILNRFASRSDVLERLILKTEDQLKLEVVYKINSGHMSRFDGQTILKVSERTLRRYLKDYADKGIAFIRHGNCLRSPPNKISNELKKKVQNLIQEKYFDFNVSHLQELLKEELGELIKYETLRKWCHEINHVKRAKKRRSKPRRLRNRMSQEGLMVQMDGSHHHWFGERFLCLMAAIDDATGEIFAQFYEGETTLACMDFLELFVKRKGIFKVLYTDKAGVYGGIKRQNFSQVERAIGELGAQVIYAHSPEAKGRVERLFNTLQDRLVAELRLHGIGTITEANKYLREVYIPRHNEKHKVLAHNHVSAYRPIPPDLELSEVFCIKEYRVVGKDHTVSINGEKWMIADPIRQSIAKQKILLKYDKWGHWKSFFSNKPIRLVKIKKDQRLAG